MLAKNLKPWGSIALVIIALLIGLATFGLAKTDPLSSLQKTRAEQLTNLFENGSFDFSYDYLEYLGDGRGITAGRAGFTTATGDLLKVIKDYTAQKPDNELAKFIPRLWEIFQKKSDTQEGLEGFSQAWKTASQDPGFQRVQDEVVDELYYQPSVKYSNQLGLRTALARAAIYDTIIQHGDGKDLDGLPAILERTRKASGGTPATGVSEKAWLDSFLSQRRETLANANNKNTHAVWSKSVGRCDVFRALAAQGNYDLQGVITINSGGFKDVLGDDEKS
jgi:chitosanase